MHVAYIISAYRLPELLVRLVRRIDAPGTSTFIHVDAKTPEPTYRAMAEPLAGLDNVQFLPRHRCDWGDFGHVRATLKGLRALIASGRPFDYVILLTGQDYPLRSNRDIVAALRDAAGTILMDWMPIPNELWDNGGCDRFENWHFRIGRRIIGLPGAPFPAGPLNAAWSRAARVFRLHRSFLPGLRPYGGSSYWMLPADCAKYVDTFVETNPGFVRYFQRVLVPDEMFFQTLVLNSPYRDRVSTRHLRHIGWDAASDHPRTLTTADLDTLLESPALFARKFDPGVDRAVLDRLDEIRS